MNIIKIIKQKQHNQQLTKEELKYAITGFLKGTIKDYQMSALLMAIYLKGMTTTETINLTRAMLEQSIILDLSLIPGLKVDKHSTGGVGDKTTLVVVPLVASCGVKVPKLSGRGLGHTGGTADKLKAITGFDINLTTKAFIKQVIEVGAAIITTDQQLVPADQKLYALRDVTGTVSSIPLIAASIMSKKIATNADKLVLDVKYGRGALVETEKEAQQLAELMITIGVSFKKEVVAVVSNMDYPLGNNIGHGLEVKEALSILKGNINSRLGELCIALATEMVSLGKNIEPEKARTEVLTNLKAGVALAKWEELVKRQGGNLKQIKVATKVKLIKAPITGYLTDINALIIGTFGLEIGMGRQTKEDIIDYGVGVVLTKKINDYVKAGDTLAKVYINKEDVNINKLNTAFVISSKPITLKPIISTIIKKDYKH